MSKGRSMQYFRLGSLVLAVAAGWISAAWAAPDLGQELALPADVGAAMRGIEAEHIRAHVRFLSDDLLEPQENIPGCSVADV